MAGGFISEKNIHDGHRSRMRAKLAAHGQSIFDTYELLEMLLYSVVPMKDTNPIAKQLLHTFGSLDGVFCAEREELLRVPGVGERVAELLLAVGKLEQVLLLEEESEGLIYTDFDKAGRAFVKHFSERDGSAVAIMLLDNNMRLLSLETVYECDYDNGDIRPKRFIDLALKKRASVVITAHTHPYGPLYPTQGDRATNGVLQTAFSAVGITMLEHFIVTGRRYIGTMSSFAGRISVATGIDEFIDSRKCAEQGSACENTEMEVDGREI